MGKGSSPRPYSVDQKTFESNWDKVFGAKEKQSEAQLQDKTDSQKEQDKCNG